MRVVIHLALLESLKSKVLSKCLLSVCFKLDCSQSFFELIWLVYPFCVSHSLICGKVHSVLCALRNISRLVKWL